MSTTTPAAHTPVAWAVFVDNGNVRLWSRDSEYVTKFAESVGMEPVALYGPSLLSEVAALRKDAERYRWLRDTLHGAKAGGGVEVNDALQVYEQPEPGEAVRIYWYQDTPVGFYEMKADTLDDAIDAAMKEQQ